VTPISGQKDTSLLLLPYWMGRVYFGFDQQVTLSEVNPPIQQKQYKNKKTEKIKSLTTDRHPYTVGMGFSTQHLILKSYIIEINQWFFRSASNIAGSYRYSGVFLVFGRTYPGSLGACSVFIGSTRSFGVIF